MGLDIATSGDLTAAAQEADRVDLSERLEKGSKQPSSNLAPLVKAYFVGDDGGSQSNALVEQDRQSSIFTTAGAVLPQYDPNILALIFENSSSLRQCIDSYVTNIDSFGHHYVPLIDLEASTADGLIADAMRAERQHAAKLSGAASEILAATEEPTAEEVAARKKLLTIEMRAERAMLENWFENCTTDQPFAGPESLRGLTRQDIEVLGYGYWEVLRNSLGEITNLNHLEGRSMRLMPMDSEAVEVEIPRRVSALSQEKVKVFKRFRRFVQVMENTNALVFFKEFEDPRIIDSKTGRAFDSLEEAKRILEQSSPGQKFRPATEVIQFKITSTRSPYGVPRWIGALLAVMGTRQSEEVNFLYFENRSIPPLAVLVSGGRLNSDTTKLLEDYIGSQIKGKRNFHKILILEAEGTGGDSNTGRMKIELKPLTDAQQKDGIFAGYESANEEKVGRAFRLPKILRGDSTDQNRSTAEAAIDFAEIQVFAPIRNQFDWIINKILLPHIGVRYHHFRSNGPTIRDPERLATMIQGMVTANILTPGEGRALARGVFNQEFEVIKAAWTEQPIGLTVAGRNMGLPEGGADERGGNSSTSPGRLPAGAAGSPGVGGGVMSQPGAASTQAALGVDQTKVETIATALQKMHASLIEEERKEWDEARKDAEVIKVPTDLFLKFFQPYNKV